MAKLQPQQGFKDVLYEKDRCDGLSNQPTTCETYSDSLRYNVFSLDSINNQRISYSSCGLPVIIMFHGGSFSNTAVLTIEGLLIYAGELSKRGFIVFNVEYRRGYCLITGRHPIPYLTLFPHNNLALYRIPGCQRRYSYHNI